jgi:hypothetical protein
VRFNSPEHLASFRWHGRFPIIHDAIADVVTAHMRGDRLLDLGCGYGLLGQRIAKQLGGCFAIGVEADAAAIGAGQAAGVTIEFAHLKVTKATVPQLLRLVERHKITTLIARRVLPELFGDDLQAGIEFAAGLSLTGVKEIFLEGRVQSISSVNPLRSVAEEVELLDPACREVKRFGAVSYLVVR